ncbi:restriction endonuclease [Pectinatus brassicae]|uniref:Restriction endonuclease type IV Mrr domain-containing protein n=1 Tax=Pectinatus brassicae TaxID=862415 RepID=A0A840UKW9_9FIRM|nr:restriction endonuclease [Pectinatus brassicae]MBB5337659.1 hypothetical protein [Pectinatus brassicae]
MKLGCGLLLIIWVISIIVQAIAAIKDALFNSLGDFGTTFLLTLIVICLLATAIIFRKEIWNIFTKSNSDDGNGNGDNDGSNGEVVYKTYPKDSREYIWSLSPRDFEEYIANMFRGLGYSVMLTPETNDGGKDIIIRKNHVTTYVECKHWNSDASIGRPELQKLAGAAALDSITNVIFISTCDFAQTTLKAANASEMMHVELWGLGKILRYAKNNPYIVGE